MKKYRRKKKIIMLSIVLVAVIIFCISTFNITIQTLNGTSDVEKMNYTGYLNGSGTSSDPWILYEDATNYDNGIKAYITGDTLKIMSAYTGGSDYAVMPDYPIWLDGDYKDSIKKVEIRVDEVANISRCAFLYFTNLETVTLITGDGNTSILKTIEENAFNGCSALTNITIPDSVTEIENYSFAGCSALTNIAIPNSVASIGEYAFYGCSALTNIRLPNSITEIGDRSFALCSALTNVTIPDSVASIGEYAFYGCTALKTITIPSSVTKIDTLALKNVNKELVIIAEGADTEAAKYAVKNNITCKNSDDTYLNVAVARITLTSTTHTIDVGETIELVPTITPTNATNKNISWTSSDDEIATVDETGKVTGVKVGTAQITATSVIDSTIKAMGVITVTSKLEPPIAVVGLYENLGATEKDDVKAILYTNGILEISGTGNMKNWSSYSDVPWYSDRESIVSVIIKEGVTNIGNFAFYDCDNLETITIPGSVTTIGASALKNVNEGLVIITEGKDTEAAKYAIKYNITCIKEDGTYLNIPGTGIIVDNKTIEQAVDSNGKNIIYITNSSEKEISKVTINGKEITTKTEDGKYIFTPTKNGEYVIVKTYSDGTTETLIYTENRIKNDDEKENKNTNDIAASGKDETITNKIIPKTGIDSVIKIAMVLSIIGLIFAVIKHKQYKW